MLRTNYDRHILALDDKQLEKFVREWVQCKTDYVEVTRFSGPGDLGRDVVGFHSKDRHEGSWHSYQCKQYRRSISVDLGINEIDQNTSFQTSINGQSLRKKYAQNPHLLTCKLRFFAYFSLDLISLLKVWKEV